MFLLTSLAFTLAHGVFLFLVLGFLLKDTVNREDVIVGLQWMLAAQVASLVFDFWNIGSWPFAEIRARTEWMMNRVILVHLSILFGMFLFMWMEQPWWFFSIFLGLKALMDIGSLVPQWKPKEPPAWLVKTMNRIGPAPGVAKKKGGLAGKRKEDETFSEYLAPHPGGGSEEVRARRRGDGACLKATPSSARRRRSTARWRAMWSPGSTPRWRRSRACTTTRRSPAARSNAASRSASTC